MSPVVLESYLADVDRGELAETLEEWQWLEGLGDLVPLHVTLAGDVILLDDSEAFWFLDASFGILERVAMNEDGFHARLQDPAFANPLLRVDLVDALRARGVTANARQCYALALSPLVGGEVSPDRVRAIDFRVYLGFNSQLAGGTKDLPIGQAFRVNFAGWPDDPEGPLASKGGELVKHARDRRSFAL